MTVDSISWTALSKSRFPWERDFRNWLSSSLMMSITCEYERWRLNRVLYRRGGPPSPPEKSLFQFWHCEGTWEVWACVSGIHKLNLCFSTYNQIKHWCLTYCCTSSKQHSVSKQLYYTSTLFGHIGYTLSEMIDAAFIPYHLGVFFQLWKYISLNFE